MFMFDKIIFIDDRYPFESGEDFIGNEILYMRKYCDKLVIIPLQALNYDTIRKECRAEVWKENRRRNKLTKGLQILPILFQKEVRNEIQTLINLGMLNLFTIQTLLLFKADWDWKLKRINKWLDRMILPNDTVLVYSYWLFSSAYIAGKLEINCKSKKIISRGHGFDIYLERNKCNYLPLRGVTLKNLDIIFPISNDGTAYLRSRYPDIASKIFTKRLGTLDHGLNPEEKVTELKIVSCSNLIPVKRVHLIPEILKYVNRSTIWIHFGDGPEMKKIMELSSKCLPDNITVCFHGAVTNDALMNIYAKEHFDWFINVSESEGIPVSIMEAMSFGIPVIATDVGGTSEIVEEGRNGFLLNKNFNPLDVSVLLTCNNVEMRVNARKTWEDKYNAERNYILFFEKLSSKNI